MNKCEKIEYGDRLPDLIHGTLIDEDRRAVEQHVAECESCAKELSLLRAVKAAAIPILHMNVSKIVNVLPAPIAVVEAPDAGKRMRFQPTLLRIAAALLVLVAGAVTLREVTSNNSRTVATSTGSASAPAEIVQTPKPAESESMTVVAKQARPTLALVTGVSELSDQDLATLTRDLERLDTRPVSEPEGITLPVSGNTEN